MGIIATLAVPSMQCQMNQSRVQAAANLIATASKNTRTQALITQRPTRMVLSNMADANQDTTVTLSYVTAASAAEQSFAAYTLDKALTVGTIPNDLTAISFTPSKQAYQGRTGKGDLMGSDMGVVVCQGTRTMQYGVKVDANSNISTEQLRSCP